MTASCLTRGALAAACTLFSVGSAFAAVATYPALDLSFSAPGSQAVNDASPVIALDPATGVWQDDGNVGAVDPTLTRYYGGIVRYTPGDGMSEWGGSVALQLLRDDGGVVFTVGKGQGSTQMSFTAPFTNQGVGPVATALPFVLKVSDAPFNTQNWALFVGANAEAAVEGTPDFSASNVFHDLSIPRSMTGLRAVFVAEPWAVQASSAELSNVFSATEWTPAVVPEPGAIALALAAGALFMRRR